MEFSVTGKSYHDLLLLIFLIPQLAPGLPSSLSAWLWLADRRFPQHLPVMRLPSPLGLSINVIFTSRGHGQGDGFGLLRLPGTHCCGRPALENFSDDEDDCPDVGLCYVITHWPPVLTVAVGQAMSVHMASGGTGCGSLSHLLSSLQSSWVILIRLTSALPRRLHFRPFGGGGCESLRDWASLLVQMSLVLLLLTAYILLDPTHFTTVPLWSEVPLICGHIYTLPSTTAFFFTGWKAHTGLGWWFLS